MNGRLFFWAITSALAGFLFGFDTVVISGAEQRIQALWSLSPAIHGVFTGPPRDVLSNQPDERICAGLIKVD